MRRIRLRLQLRTMLQKYKTSLILVLLMNIAIVRRIVSLSASASASSRSFSTSTSTSTSALNMKKTTKTIDSHLHVWATEAESTTYPYASIDQTPPPSLIDSSSTTSLLTQMKEHGVDGALIVQPINHQYDHRYVSNAIETYPDKFKGMMLFDPSIVNGDEAVSRLEELVLKGFVGVRFNPYLFEGKGGDSAMMRMSDHEGAIAVLKRCGELKLPVGIMCFKGIDLHYDDIVTLCNISPTTPILLDHFGFASVDNHDNTQFDMVCQLGQTHDNVHVKISAMFRVAGTNGSYPFDNVKKQRFDKLLEVYGPNRLMFGTDFPFITEQKDGYKGGVDVVRSWVEDKDENVKDAIMGGTAERLFGAWGS